MNETSIVTFLAILTAVAPLIVRLMAAPIIGVFRNEP
jgi:hypothetical protein